MSDDTDPGRLHTSVLVGPEGELRRHRKARAQAAARIHAEARAETVAKLRAEAAAAREARRATRWQIPHRRSADQ